MDVSKSRAVAFLGLGLLVLAGCAYPPEDTTHGGEPVWSLHGAFKASRTQADMQDLQNRVEARGGQVTIMESFPEQFRASGLTASACDALRAELNSVDYLQSVGSCGPASS